MSIRRETSEDDDLRTRSLLDAVDVYAEATPSAQFDDGAFETVLVTGLGCDSACTDYPPAGHTYPRRG